MGLRTKLWIVSWSSALVRLWAKPSVSRSVICHCGPADVARHNQLIATEPKKITGSFSRYAERGKSDVLLFKVSPWETNWAIHPIPKIFSVHFTTYYLLQMFLCTLTCLLPESAFVCSTLSQTVSSALTLMMLQKLKEYVSVCVCVNVCVCSLFLSTKLCLNFVFQISKHVVHRDINCNTDDKSKLKGKVFLLQRLCRDQKTI